MTCQNCTGCKKKPVVEIKNAELTPAFEVDSATLVQCLIGDVEEYPEGHGAGSALSGERIRTSRILKIDGNTVETRNTIYKVLNWL